MSLDWELFKALHRATDDPIWDAASHPDVSVVAASLGVSRNTVTRRIQEWRRIGFLQGYEFLPNPKLFGVGLTGVMVTHSTPGTPNEFLEALELVDGIFRAYVQLESRSWLICIADSPAEQARRRALIGRLPTVAAVTAMTGLWLPEFQGQPTDFDWRLMAALRFAPESSFVDLAGELGVTPRTFSRRFRTLRQKRILLTVFCEDPSRYPGTLVRIVLIVQDPTRAREVAARVEQVIPGLLEMAPPETPLGAPSEVVAYLAEVENLSRLGDMQRLLDGLPGVARVQSSFPGAERGYRGWMDDQLHRVLRTRSPGIVAR